MSQIFHRSTNSISRLSIFGALIILGLLLWITVVVSRSGYVTQAGIAREQPIQFSHAHHVGGMGIDCRYCHSSVEESPFANVPPTKTCMSCHSQIWAQSPMLEPVRSSFRTGQPMEWTRVHDLPDFAYFNHSIHVKQGIGCVTCHGEVNRMPLMSQYASLTMEWCLECHRAPQRFIRPRNQVFNMEWEPPADDPDLGARLVKEYRIGSVEHLTSCSTCHR